MAFAFFAPLHGLCEQLAPDPPAPDPVFALYEKLIGFTYPSCATRFAGGEGPDQCHPRFQWPHAMFEDMVNSVPHSSPPLSVLIAFYDAS